MGFLAAIGDDQHGVFGGYLVLNATGRPLEFHCTAPVKPNRAQEILYGPTLQPYLYGEQIGQTLVNKAKLKPPVVLTDTRRMLALRDYVKTPVAWVELSNRSENDEDDGDICAGSDFIRFAVGTHQLVIPRPHADDQAQLIDVLTPIATSVDLSEPFLRIRDAIQEANRAA